MLQGFDQIGRPPRISPLVDRKMAGWGLSDQSMDLTKTNYLEGAAMPWPTSLSTRALPWSNALPPPPPRSQSTPPFQGPAQMRTSQNPNPKTQLRLGMSLENSKYWRAESNESQVTAQLSCRVCTTRSLLLLPLCCSCTLYPTSSSCWKWRCRCCVWSALQKPTIFLQSQWPSPE